jgi:acyl transferase domain-containing protein
MSLTDSTIAPADGIAVIGMQGRFPGAHDVDEFWENLKNGVESISTFSEAELRNAGIDLTYLNVPGYINRGCVLENIDQFDAAFFGYSARDAETMDPQQRIFLECAWESLEQAGYDPDTYPGMIGVFAGCDQSSYLYQIYANVDMSAYGYGGMMAIGNEKDYLATQISYKLNLRGPSMAIQTSCSTSLVAVCVACQNIRHGYCDMALAGGVGISVPQKKGYWYQPGGIVSPDGHCRPFDAGAQGTVVGNGVGIVVLKRLSDALKDGDNILCVIKGFGLNNDGAAKVGYTAPSIEGQSQAIKMAQRMAGVEPDTIGYVEAHGTATALGDPIEIAALTKSFRERTDKKQFCAVGALKSNVGHLSSAAGISGLIKGILTVQHGQIPPTLHYQQPNPQLDLTNSPFFIASKLMSWPMNGEPRRAGVSSFGVGGTNAHVVLEQAPAPLKGEYSREKQVLLLSARTSTALENATDNLVSYLEKTPDADLADVAFTLQTGRRPFAHRRAVVFERNDQAGLVAALATRHPEYVHTSSPQVADRSVVFLFSGQGTQYVDMGADLYRTEPTFRQHLDECGELLIGEMGLDIRGVLYPTSDREKAAELLTRTSMTQPALFVIEYALARLWMEWGIMPKAMIGHSIGEYVAACLAEVMTLREALSVVAMRGRLMESMPGGSMLAVPLPEGALQPVLQPNVSLAAVNAPAMSVLAGPTELIDGLEKQFVAQGLPCRKLHTSHAFHSSMMDPVIPQFVDRMKRVKLRPPQIPYLSNLTGVWMTPELATSPEYWGYHLRQTVRFSDNLRELMAFPDLALLEVGPGQTLGMLARHQGSRTTSQMILSSLPGPQEKDQFTDSDLMAWAVGQMWLGGVKLDWSGYHRHERRRRVPLPTYPFERQRYWLGPLEESALLESQSPARPQQWQAATEQWQAASSSAAAFAAPAPARKAERNVSGWFSAPVWKPAVNPARAPLSESAGEPWLVFGATSGLGQEVRDRLSTAGGRVNMVVPGAEFAWRDSYYEIRPGDRDDYEALAQDLKRRNEYPTRVLHLWSSEQGPPHGSPLDDFDEAATRSFYSVMFLSQALAKVSATAKLQVGVVTSCLHPVLGDEPLQSNEATVLGACKVISQEYPNLRCRNIDIVRGDPGAADALIREMSDEPFQAVVAYRKGRRWLEAYEPVSLERPGGKIPLLTDGSTYLMTGGLGNIALLLAEAIAADVKARFLLTGRSPFPQRAEWDDYLKQKPFDATSAKIKRLMSLEKSGSEVMVVQADAADPGQMRAAVGQAVDRWGAIHCVIHGAANLSSDAFGPARSVDRAAGDSHFRPKAHGLLIVDDLLRDQPLQFCFLLSSLSAVLGGLGLACYAASNAYLDAVARQRNLAGKARWISVNWDSWNFTQGRTQEDAINPEEGQDCFRRIMASSLTQVAVSTTPLSARLAQWVELQPAERQDKPPAAKAAGVGGNGASPAGAAEAAGAAHARPNLSTQFAAPVTETEKTITAVWEHLLGVAPVGIHDKFFELGGHSLLAIQLLARLREVYDLDLPVQTIFESPTISQLARSIDEQKKAAPDAPAETGDPGLDEMLKLVEGMSEAEIEALLKEATASDEGGAVDG